MIRRCEIKDIEAVKKLLSQVLDVHHKGRSDIFKANCRKYTDDELKKIIDNDLTPVFVYDFNGEVLGYCFCIIKQIEGDNIFQDMKSLYVDDLCVDENARGKKIGNRLYEYVKAYAKEIGCYNITLNVWECNSEAKNFYEKLGFKPQKTVMEEIL